ncbi:MAG: restriction endonuclease subunit S, partial [Candidatus Bruticola sp.]
KEYALLDQLVKSRFMEMFGDLTNNTKWKLCKISEIAQVCVGVVVKPAQYYAASGIPTFRSQNIGEMQVKDNEWVYFTNDGNDKNRKSIVQEHDVLVVRSGAPGTACVVDSQHAGYNAIDIIIVRPNASLINSVFLAAITNSHTIKKRIITATNGVAQKHLNVNQYKSLTIPLPPLPLQQQFAAFVEKVDKSKFIVGNRLAGRLYRNLLTKLSLSEADYD